MILEYSLRILRKEREKLFLPFASILFTTSVVVLSYFLISSTSAYLSARDKEFIGGDVALESAKEFDISTYIPVDDITKETRELSFQGLVSRGERAAGASFSVVDANYPLYGEIVLEAGKYAYPGENEIYVDEALKQSLSLTVGDVLSFNERDFIVKGIVTQDPESLLGGFSFSPKIIMPEEAIAYSGIDLALFRKEYGEKAILKGGLGRDEKAELRSLARKDGVRINFEGGGQSGLQFGLEIVKKFLIVVIILVVILALVNIYSSVNFLAERLRRSFAILMSLGLESGSVYRMLLFINSFVILTGIILGTIAAYALDLWIVGGVKDYFQIELGKGSNLWQLASIIFLIYATSIFATLPVAARLRTLSPKELLFRPREERSVFGRIFKDILFGLCPVTLISIYFLESFLYGLAVVGGLMVVYGLVMLVYHYSVRFLHLIRNTFPFSLRLIVAQKRFDGFLGMVSFASLFVALAAVFSLSLLRTSIDGYLRGDLQDNIPSVYVLDLQKSQISQFKSLYPESVLFPNVRARLVSIDGLDIQKELEKEDSSLDREFSREFNLTYRKSLLEGEEVVQGDFAGIKKGELSLEEDFAERLGAKMGSVLKVNIQGFDLEAEVTSIRRVNTRSGLPFFFLVYSPEDLERFPSTSFGYLDISSGEVGSLSKSLSENFPNVSLIDTSRIAKVAENIIGLLLVIILVITVPPIILSLLLIINIIAILSKDRKRDGARLMVLGKTKEYVRNFFIVESAATLVTSSLAAYIFAVLISNFLTTAFLEFDNKVFIDPVSLYIFASILAGIVAASALIWSQGGRSVKDNLNYEENN